jgi:8-oxo-dGTP diphosphatase
MSASDNAIPSSASDVPKVGVGVLILNAAGQVLLTLRKMPPEAGHWSIVGGKVDFLETLQHCAIREAREEVGLEISLVRLLCVTDHCLPDENQHWVSPAYLGQILSGEARNCEPDKTRQIAWFSFTSVPTNLTITARNAIRAYLAQTAGEGAHRESLNPAML